MISKSRFLQGMQCEKQLFFEVYRKDLKVDHSDSHEGMFSAGAEIGLLAQQVFPRGELAAENSNGNLQLAINRTIQCLNKNVTTIYEAAFSQPGAFAALDILHHTQGERWAIEVKGTTEVKDYHLTDAAYQYWIMENCGYKPDRFFIMHINNLFIKGTHLFPQQFFSLTEITEKVINRQSKIASEHTRLINILQQKIEPNKGIGKYCKSPFICPFYKHCWKQIPDDSVFDLYSPKGRDWAYYNKGVLRLQDIEDITTLNIRQQHQVKGIKYKTTVINKSAIKEFLSLASYPLYFFDFETIFPSIPMLQASSPFQQIPFQYSLHILNGVNSKLQHREFLANPKAFQANNIHDPRLELLAQLKKDIGSMGSIIAYNAPFEKSILKNMAKVFPQEKEFINGLLQRFVDLIIPFRECMYYLPKMKGSASIKDVLPAINQGFSYRNLEVQNGGEASRIFYAMIQQTYTGDIEKTRKALLEYCKQDTLGMVIIWKHLQKISQY